MKKVVFQKGYTRQLFTLFLISSVLFVVSYQLNRIGLCVLFGSICAHSFTFLFYHIMECVISFIIRVKKILFPLK